MSTSFKSALVALALVGGSAGGAFAETRTINVWGARLDVPVAEQAPAAIAAAARPTTFMALDETRRDAVRHGSETRR